MKIRSKLIISNILVILIPLLLGLGLIAVFISGPANHYWETMEKIFKDENRIYSAQSLLSSYEGSGDTEQIKKELSNAGYHFSVTRDGQTLYSNINSDDLSQAKKAAGEFYGSRSTYSISEGPVTVIHESYKKNSFNYDMMAIHTDNIKADKGESYMQRYIALYIAFILLILVLSIIVVNLILTWWISRSILRPLKKLSKGSELIREGYLDFELSHDKNDEIGSVLKDFEEMRSYLKDSVTERLKYEQYRKDLIIGISHDLRTPLTSIKGYVEGLRDGIPSSEDMETKYYDAIESSINNLEKLIAALTEFSKSESQDGNSSRERTEMNNFFREQVKTLKDKYIKDNIELSFNGCDRELYADIDRSEIERINLNLLENTLKYRKGESSRVTYSLAERDGTLEIRIADDGPGVADEDLEKIFECFYRADKARTGSCNGSGIGLAVVKRIVESHDGKVRAENDEGLTLIISLPLKDTGVEGS